jgi:hypothetical protein
MLIVFLLLLVLPAAAVLATALLVSASTALTVGVGSLLSALVLLAETYGIAHWIGRAFERLEPTHLT